jgi:hypothetical protein
MSCFVERFSGGSACQCCELKSTRLTPPRDKNRFTLDTATALREAVIAGQWATASDGCETLPEPKGAALGSVEAMRSFANGGQIPYLFTQDLAPSWHELS